MEYKGPRYWFRYLELTSYIRDFAVNKKILEIGPGPLGLATYVARNHNEVIPLDLLLVITLSFLKYLSNKFTVYPFWLISKIFVRLDWSQARLIFIKK
jgi:hypothetical protein